MSDQKKNIPEDRFQTVPNVRPFTKYRAVELAVCGVCVLLGVLYLYAKVLTLSVLLPVYAVCFCAIPVLQYLDIKASGRTGFVNYLPPIFWGVISVAVIVAAVAYFVG
ncbi:MAG: hypothetical protein E7579_08075 [Ruminococcaceae bacterium]|nr:hypothetical protein [Oscillospiraceae bacterium]